MIAQDQGYIFEVGFNLGILTGFEKFNLGSEWVSFYLPDLQQLKYKEILKKLITRSEAISTLDRQLIKQWSQLVLLRGFLAGFNFFDEFFSSTGYKAEKTEVLYYQACFVNSNSIDTYFRDEDDHYNLILEQFSLKFENLDLKKINDDKNIYKQKGEFLKADTLILLRHKKSYKIVVVDTSMFALRSEEDITNLDLIEVIKDKLQREINYLRSKSSFCKLMIDTGADSNLDFSFSEGLKYHFSAFKYQDKESNKLIQAASYAYSYTKFLLSFGIVNSDSDITVSAIGYSERNINTMTVRKDNFSLLETCHTIYKKDSSEQEKNLAREKVLNLIKSKARLSFNQGQDLINKLFAVGGYETKVISHQECLDDFFNTVGLIPETLAHRLNIDPKLDLRNAHAQLINRALLGKCSYIFLTGNPGIGKTTAIANFLRQHLDEGFLFFYVSPRKQVNIDILEKFKTEDKLCDDRVFYLNTNAYIIEQNSSNFAIEYLSNLTKDDFTLENVNFIDARKQQKQGVGKSSTFKRQSEDLLHSVNGVSRGVIDSLGRGINQLIQANKSNQIIATACIQSLKKTKGGNTLEHLEKIFQSAYIERKSQVIPSKMRAISSKIKHLFIMIDEITGDSSGVEFLSEISRIAKKYEILEGGHGFNTKIIVADASIVDKDVINQHLGDNSPEGDKIFFRKVSQEGLPLAWDEFIFKGKQAIAINANSYPASSLNITYKLVIEAYKFDEEKKLKENDLIKKVHLEILKDIEEIELQSSAQILVYIQNKERLQQLISKLKQGKKSFNPQEDYLEIHANITDYERKKIEECKNKVKIIFMTSSGSRGLSFPKVKHILVDIPKFQIESNLMEIIQVIYRGRGDFKLDQEAKELRFYLGERAIYNEHTISLQESLLNILKVLLLLKAAIMTRIKGASLIGNEHFLIIPIGGKSIFRVNNNLSFQMSDLMRNLRQECRANPWDKVIEETYADLTKLLSQATFELTPEANNLTYLKLQEQLHSNFEEIINQGFDGLLKYKNLESAYLCGSLIIVPAKDNALKENYLINLNKIIDLVPQLKQKLKQISANELKYHDNLRSSVMKALDLMENLENQHRSQQIEQKSIQDDLYYGFTVFTLLNNQVIKDYLALEEATDNISFREILEIYLRSLYSVGGVLPLGDRYDDFPFIIFNSYILREMREKMFTDRYLLNSQEFNVVNLILSK